MTRLTISDLETRGSAPDWRSGVGPRFPRRPGESGFRLHFVIAGAPRCGTTWLCKNLNDHPDITCFRESTYFNDRRVYRRYRREHVVSWLKGHGPGPIYGCSEPGIWNRRAADLFDDPSYDYQPLADPVAVLKTFEPGVSIIVSLRDPVDRALSHLRFHWRNLRRLGFGEGVTTAGQALFEELPYRHRQQILNDGNYLQNLRPFQRRFDHLRILLYERDIREHPRRGLGRLLQFLDDRTPHDVEHDYEFQRADTVINEAPERTENHAPKITPGCRRRLEQYYRESKLALFEQMPEARDWWT